MATEIRFQSPPTCPANHVPRLGLMKKISSALLTSDTTPTIGTTVTIRGIGGIGKSTIAKALCHDPVIKKHFVSGFLWISLTPPVPNPVTMLSEIYNRLTSKSTTILDVSILKNEIKCLVSSCSCKLLVILDDVWEVKDAMMLVDVFSSCKTVLTTRKMNINEKIPPMMCFDVKPMSIDEAVKLLTLQIVEVKTTDISRIQQLATDLHCWPLLLNLVHGQLYVHCTERKEAPQDAILKVQQKLFDNGLTAFDPENQDEASRENAVRASITASLELLTKNEENILYFIASSLVGFGLYTFKDLLSAVLQMDPKQFDRLINNLWCHGLISFQDVTFSSAMTKIPCIGIHEVIGHFLNGNMPDEFFATAGLRTGIVFRDKFLDKYFHLNTVTNVTQAFLSYTDIIRIPFWQRISLIHAKYIQIKFFNILNSLVEQNIELLHNICLKNIIQNNQLPPLKHIHKIIVQDCKSVHLLLTNGQYNEAITWAKQYFECEHPLKLTLEAVITNLTTLLDSCKSSSTKRVTLAIENSISVFENELFLLNSFLRIIILNITGYSHVVYLANAAASDDDVYHYLYCAGCL